MVGFSIWPTESDLLSGDPVVPVTQPHLLLPSSDSGQTEQFPHLISAVDSRSFLFSFGESFPWRILDSSNRARSTRLFRLPTDSRLAAPPLIFCARLWILPRRPLSSRSCFWDASCPEGGDLSKVAAPSSLFAGLGLCSEAVPPAPCKTPAWRQGVKLH